MRAGWRGAPGFVGGRRGAPKMGLAQTPLHCHSEARSLGRRICSCLCLDCIARLLSGGVERGWRRLRFVESAIPRRGTPWTAPHPCLIVRQVPSGDRRLHKTESAPATKMTRLRCHSEARSWGRDLQLFVPRPAGARLDRPAPLPHRPTGSFGRSQTPQNGVCASHDPAVLCHAHGEAADLEKQVRATSILRVAGSADSAFYVCATDGRSPCCAPIGCPPKSSSSAPKHRGGPGDWHHSRPEPRRRA